MRLWRISAAITSGLLSFEPAALAQQSQYGAAANPPARPAPPPPKEAAPQSYQRAGVDLDALADDPSDDENASDANAPLFDGIAPPEPLRHHGLFFDAGSLVHLAPWYECVNDCDGSWNNDEDASHHGVYAWLPFAGLRYTYFHDVYGHALQERSRVGLDVFVHLIGPSLNAMPEGASYERGQSSGPDTLGGRMGIR